MSQKPLTLKQQEFVNQYILHKGNISQATQAMGYKKSIAGRMGQAFLKRGAVKQAIAKRLNTGLRKEELTSQIVLKQLANLVTRDPLDLCDENGKIVVDDMSKIPARMRGCIDGIKQKIKTYLDKESGEPVTETEIEIRMSPKLPAVKLAMEYFQMIAQADTDSKQQIDWSILIQPTDIKKPDLLQMRIANPTLPKEVVEEKFQRETTVEVTKANYTFDDFEEGEVEE